MKIIVSFNLLISSLFLFGCASTQKTYEPIHAYEGEKKHPSELALVITSYEPGGLFTSSKTASFISLDGFDLANDFSELNPTQIYILPGEHSIEVMYGNNLLFIYSFANSAWPRATISGVFKAGETYTVKWYRASTWEPLEFFIEDRQGNVYSSEASENEE